MQSCTIECNSVRAKNRAGGVFSSPARCGVAYVVEGSKSLCGRAKNRAGGVFSSPARCAARMLPKAADFIVRACA